MELLQRYLQAVKFWLPRAQQDDITAELSEDLHARLEDRQAELGRQLSPAEVAAFLLECGPPVPVASRYLPQRSLIGPVLFPVYCFVLKIVAFCYLGPWLLVLIALPASDHNNRPVIPYLAHALGTFWFIALTGFSVVTVVFAVLERTQTIPSFLNKWEPRRLPPLRSSLASRRHIARFSSVVEIAVNLFFVVWIANGLWSPSFMTDTLFEATGTRLLLAPIWRSFLYAFLLVAIGNIALAIVNLIRPLWTRSRGILRLVLDGIASILICDLFKTPILLTFTAPQISATRAAALTATIHATMAGTFPYVVLACVMIILLADVPRLLRTRPSTPARYNHLATGVSPDA